MRYWKAILGALVAGLGALAAGLPDGLTGPEILTAVVAALVAAGGVGLVPNAGFLDLSKLPDGVRAQIERTLAGGATPPRGPAGL